MQLERITGNRWLVFDEPRLLRWCAERIPHATAEGWYLERAQPLGISDGRDLLAVMVVHGYERQHGNAQISMAAASPRWASRPVIAKLLSYPFEQLRCQRITTLIPASNARAIRFNEGIGFQREGLARRGFGTEDCVILGLLAEERPAWARLAPSSQLA
ncbi:MAG: GNAT family N-acetyltransferase [Sphingomonas oligoaromativorans]